MPDSTKPPLWVFGCAVFLAVVSLLLLDNIHRTGLVPEATADLNINRFANADSHRFHVVAMGTSKTRQAIHFDNLMSEQIQQHGVDAHFSRVTWTSANLDDLAPGLQALEAHAPDVLLLEAELLLLEPWGKTDTKALLLNNLYENIQSLKAAFSTRTQSRENWLPMPAEPVEACKGRKSESLKARYRKLSGQRRISTAAERDAYFRLLEPLIANGTRVVILDIPRSPIMEQLFPETLRNEEIALREELLGSTELTYLTPPASLITEAMYCDLGHFNSIGQNAYSRWLAEFIAGLAVNRGV